MYQVGTVKVSERGGDERRVRLYSSNYFRNSLYSG